VTKPACVECGGALPAARDTGRPRRYCTRACQARAYRRRRDRGRTAVPHRAAAGPAGGAESVLDAAIELADHTGVDAVTVRAVALRAGVAPATVHRRVGNRDALVTAMVQRVFGAPVEPTGPPRERLAALARWEWQRYRDHPWLVPVLATTRPPLVPAVLAGVDATVRALVDHGLDPADALSGYLTLSGYVQGMALLLTAERRELATAVSYRTWWSTEAARLRRTGATQRHPWLTAAALSPDPDLTAWFEAGLHRVLTGILAMP
jgi:AcrR family transcriptional regulator